MKDKSKTDKQAVVSHIQTIAEAKKGWSEQEFRGHMLSEAGVGVVTSQKIWKGDTRLTIRTLAKVAMVLGETDLNKLITIQE